MAVDAADGTVLGTAPSPRGVSYKKKKFTEAEREKEKTLQTSREQEFRTRLDPKRGVWTDAKGRVHDLSAGEVVKRLHGEGRHRPGAGGGLSVLERDGNSIIRPEGSSGRQITRGMRAEPS